MNHDEHEMLVEFSEMTAFNFNSKEYQEIKQDFIECKETAYGIEWIMKDFLGKFRRFQST